MNQGASATFTVGATGATPLSYQWRFEGTNLAGATASSYTRPNAQPVHEGDYSVVITNIAGAVTSENAFLVVNIPPSIGVQPQSQSLKRGQDATFFVTADGTEPLALPVAVQRREHRRRGRQQLHARQRPDQRLRRLFGRHHQRGGVRDQPNAMLTVTLPLPSRFQSITLLPDGRARLVVTGETGVACAIDGSSNLAGWFELMSLMNTNGTLDVVDHSASNSSLRFYRARQ